VQTDRANKIRSVSKEGARVVRAPFFLERVFKIFDFFKKFVVPSILFKILVLFWCMSLLKISGYATENQTLKA